MRYCLEIRQLETSPDAVTGYIRLEGWPDLGGCQAAGESRREVLMDLVMQFLSECGIDFEPGAELYYGEELVATKH